MRSIIDGVVAATLIVCTFAGTYLLTLERADAPVSADAETAAIVQADANEVALAATPDPPLVWSEDEEDLDDVASLREDLAKIEAERTSREQRLHSRLKDLEFEAFDRQREDRQAQERRAREAREKLLADQIAETDRINAYREEQEENRRQERKLQEERMRQNQRQHDEHMDALRQIAD